MSTPLSLEYLDGKIHGLILATAMPLATRSGELDKSQVSPAELTERVLDRYTARTDEWKSGLEDAMTEVMHVADIVESYR